MELRNPLDKIITLDRLVALRKEYRQKGVSFGTTNGCFDLLHWGHIQYLWNARSEVGVLAVLINADDTVRQLKGPSRPIQNEQTRMQQMAGLESVDYVCLFQERTPAAALSQLQPDIHFKGGDYHPDTLPEGAVVQSAGGKIRCLSLAEGFSTTNLEQRIRRID